MEHCKYTTIRHPFSALYPTLAMSEISSTILKDHLHPKQEEIIPSVPRGGAVLAADVAAPPALPLVRHEGRALPRRVAHLVAPAALPAPALGLKRAGVAHGTLGR